MAWTAITNAAVAAGAALTTALMTALRDNIIQAQGALKPLAEVTISSDATVDFTQFDNSIYRKYRFVFENVKAVSDTIDLQMLMSTDGGSTFANGGSFALSYAFRGLKSDGSGLAGLGGRQVNQINLVTGARNNDAGAYFGISGHVDVIGAGTTQNTTMHSRLLAQNVTGTTLDPMSQIIDGAFNGDVDTDAVRFQFSSGNMASGTIKMYGILDTIEAA